MTNSSAEYRSELLDFESELSEFESWLNERESRLRAAGLLDPPPLFRVTTDPHPSGEFISVDEDGTPVLHCHINQAKALAIECRFLLVLAGWQSGKSSVGPPWLVREMRRQGPGNYLAAAPSFKLLDKYPVPGIRLLLGRILGLGEVVGGAMGEFRVSEEGHKRLWPEDHWPEYDPDEPSRIIFGHADNADSLASFTGKGAWLDEPGQKRFKQESNEEIRGRLATTGGRMLYTSRPYTHHWLKTDVYDRADRNRKADKEAKKAEAEGREPEVVRMTADAGYEVVEFESIDNPKFSREEWDSAKLTMPGWRFDMKYRGRFTKPAGAIYDSFDPDFHKIPATYVPDSRWRIYCGIDFGAPNFYAVFIAEEPGEFKKRIAFAEYRPLESRRFADHIDAMNEVMRKAFRLQAQQWAAMSGESEDSWTRLPDLCVGGSKSENQWRREFASLGWPIKEPDQPDVEVGIGRVWSCFAEDRLFISEACPYLLEDVQAYSREVDEDGEPISDTIEDKDTRHACDGLRYIVGYLEAKGTGVGAWGVG